MTTAGKPMRVTHTGLHHGINGHIGIIFDDAQGGIDDLLIQLLIPGASGAPWPPRVNWWKGKSEASVHPLAFWAD